MAEAKKKRASKKAKPEAEAEKELTPQQLVDAKLLESGLDAADAKRLGMRALTGKQTIALHPSFKAVASLLLPYHDALGKDTGFYRVRYLGKVIGFEAATKKGTQRYAQAPDTDAGIYITRGHDWKELFANTQVPIHITEGELKSAAACKAGFPTLGLGGVWSWKSSKKGEAMLPILKGIKWKGRQVYIAFDSDAATNPGVAKAQAALCEELCDLGAQPYCVQLPVLEPGKKCGLDDLLVALGPKAYEDALETSMPYAAARELWSMNTEVAYVKDPGLVVEVATGLRMTPAAFISHAYANRHYHEPTVRKDGTVALVKKPLAKGWMEWPQRSQLERLTYAPGQPRITEANEYNFWRGWGCEPKRGDVTLWKELLDFLFKEDKNARTWFERWCAYPLQHPGVKMYTTSVMWGVTQGTGKSLVGYSLGHVYGDNFTEIDEDQLGGSFNEWAQNRQFVMGDDVTSTQTRNGLADRIKSMVTRQKIRINAKHLPTYEVMDRINYYFTSQHPDAFFVEDYDRRYFVHEVVGAPLPREYYRRYDDWLRSGNCGPALFDHLMRLDLGDFDPKSPAYETSAKRLMVLDGKSDLGAWVNKLKTEPDAALRLGEAVISGDLFGAEELVRLYDPENRSRVTANGMGRELKRAGFRLVNDGTTVRTPRGPLRLYAVRNADKWLKARIHLVSAHAAEHRGGASTAPKKPKF